MNISIIVAMSTDRIIGMGNSLPWRLPADLRRFKTLTMGHGVILGRKTFESIGKPLPGRSLIVVTRQVEFVTEGVQVAHSVEQALEMAPGNEVFIAGGSQIYSQTLDRADRMYLTLVEGTFLGDTWFPAFGDREWQLLEEEHHSPDEKNLYPYCFRVYERRSRV